MHQLVVGFALCSALLSVACGDNYGEADHLAQGIAAFEMPSAPGVSFEAAISVVLQDDPGAVSQVSVAQGEGLIEVELPPGSYTANLDTFAVYENGAAVPDVEVTFVGFDPDPIIITPFGTTRVTLAFELGDDTVLDADREAELIVNRGCTPLCSAAQKCLDVNEAGPACYPTCNEDTPCAASTTCYPSVGICL
jgi:hypothetical protein